jgi:hypothetical protein
MPTGERIDGQFLSASVLQVLFCYYFAECFDFFRLSILRGWFGRISRRGGNPAAPVEVRIRKGQGKETFKTVTIMRKGEVGAMLSVNLYLLQK